MQGQAFPMVTTAACTEAPLLSNCCILNFDADNFYRRAGARSFDPFTATGRNERVVLTRWRLVASGERRKVKVGFMCKIKLRSPPLTFLL